MIDKLIVLNGTEGHVFEVGKNYIFSGINEYVRSINVTDKGYKVEFMNGTMNVYTRNVMVFHK